MHGVDNMGYFAQMMIDNPEEMRQEDTGEAEYWDYVEQLKIDAANVELQNLRSNEK